MQNNFRILKFVVGVAIFLSFLYITSVMLDPDLGWHLRVGEWVFEHKAVQRVDVSSYTMPGFPWIDHEWLVNAGLWWLYSQNLWWVVVFLFTLFAFIPVLVWLVRADSRAKVAAVILGSTFLLSFIGVRPQILSLFFFFFVSEILYARLKGKRSLLLLLPLLFFLWVNLHAGFFGGLLFFGAFVFADYVRAFVRTGRLDDREAGSSLLIFSLSFFVTFLNAHGGRIYKEILSVILPSYTSKYIVEWQPAFVLSNIAVPIFIGVFLFFAVKFIKKYPLHVLFTNFLFFFSFIKTVRMGPLFLVSAMPLLFLGIDLAFSEARTALHKTPFTGNIQNVARRIWGGVFAVLFLLLGYGVLGYDTQPFPGKAVAFLREEARNGSLGNILNDYGLGGYLSWRAPEIKIFIDGRMPNWIGEDGSSAMKDYVAIFFSGDEDMRQEVFERRKIQTVFLKKGVAASEESQKKDERNIFRGLKAHLGKSSYVRRLVNFLKKGVGQDLSRALLKEGWEKIYDDEEAVILRCREEVCSYLKGGA